MVVASVGVLAASVLVEFISTTTTSSPGLSVELEALVVELLASLEPTDDGSVEDESLSAGLSSSLTITGSASVVVVVGGGSVVVVVVVEVVVEVEVVELDVVRLR